MRLLVINIFFDPMSFGGATVVAEQVAAEIDRMATHEVTAVSATFEKISGYRITRYHTRFGFDGFQVSLPNPDSQKPLVRTRNEAFDQALSRILDFVAPDAVHVHCTQDIGASFFDELKAREIPLMVTVHDFWYFCERQFMIDIAGEFCGQRAIDIDRCAACSSNRAETVHRTAYLMGQLAKADLVVTPSDYARDMLVANGLAPDQVRVNKNGVAAPSSADGRGRTDWTDGPVRVGFIGGPGAIKGWDLIIEAFRTDPQLTTRVRIIAVDAGANAGHPWKEELLENADDLPIEIVPGYRPDTIDAAFARFDAVICPSRWKETFGLFAREATIRGKWVIASDAGGLAEDIDDGVNGRVLAFPPTAASVAGALKELADRTAPPAFDQRVITTFDHQAKEAMNWLQELASKRAAAYSGASSVDDELPQHDRTSAP
ncbi:MAG: glycosyltransferase family 4 protein [Pseudomonadota bacterium]